MKKFTLLLFTCMAAALHAQQNCQHTSTAYRFKYNRLESYIPDSTTPVKTVQLNFIIFQKGDGTGNYQDTPDDHLKLDTILEWVNGFYERNRPPSDPIEGVEFIKDTRIRFEVGEHVFFIRDTYAHDKDDVNYFQKLADSIPGTRGRLNIFFTEAHYLNNPEIEVGGKAQPPSYSNAPQFLVMYHPYNNGIVNFATSITLAHELGHILSLLHTYDGSETCNTKDPDYLWDVFGRPPSNQCPHKSGFFLDPSIPGDAITNNIMGSTNVAFYFSPLQMAKMHRALSLMNVRNYVKDCPSGSVPIKVKGSEKWDFSMRTYGDILIGNKDTLWLSCSINMPTDASIRVARGGCLVVDGGTISGSCGSWKGIEVARKKSIFNRMKKRQSTVIIKNGGKIEGALKNG
jgi:hypothetical protein